MLPTAMHSTFSHCFSDFYSVHILYVSHLSIEDFLANKDLSTNLVACFTLYLTSMHCLSSHWNRIGVHFVTSLHHHICATVSTKHCFHFLLLCQRLSSLVLSSKNASTHLLLTHSGWSNKANKNLYRLSIRSSKNWGESLWNGPVFGGKCILLYILFSLSIKWTLLRRYRNWEYRRRHVCWVLPRNTSIL